MASPESSSKLILVINCGSSSLKFALLTVPDMSVVLSGLGERLGAADASIRFDIDGERIKTELGQAGHDKALATLIDFLDKRNMRSRIAAIGHRVVHGGERFTASVAITPEVLADIEAVSVLAPLHNPANVVGIRAAMEALPGLPNVAVFDTAFHQTMPTKAFLYALPRKYQRELGVRRYGMHGTSHRYVSGEAVKALGLDPENHGIIVAHLGNGASATAIQNGKCVDTTMGMTPLEGLVMGTRCGDVDVGAILYIARHAGLDIDGIDNLVNKQSGLLGMSEISNDCRTVEQAAAEGNQNAKDALDVMTYRIARTISALTAGLTRLDAVVFTGGIGENSASTRAAAIAQMPLLGIEIDDAANDKMFGGKSGVISKNSSDKGPVAIVIPTDEERMIAIDTASIALA